MRDGGVGVKPSQSRLPTLSNSWRFLQWELPRDQAEVGCDVAVHVGFRKECGLSSGPPAEVKGGGVTHVLAESCQGGSRLE